MESRTLTSHGLHKHSPSSSSVSSGNSLDNNNVHFRGLKQNNRMRAISFAGKSFLDDRQTSIDETDSLSVSTHDGVESDVDDHKGDNSRHQLSVPVSSANPSPLKKAEPSKRNSTFHANAKKYASTSDLSSSSSSFFSKLNFLRKKKLKSIFNNDVKLTTKYGI